jgi:phage gp36-like protein
MAYCTLSDILEQIPEHELMALTDDDGVDAVDTSVTDRAIADADAEIDGYCGKRYAVPFPATPVILRKISVDIVIYNLFARRQGAPDDRRTRYKDAVNFLEGVAKGLVSLGVEDPDSTLPETGKPRITSSDRVFSRSTMAGF